MSDNRFTTFKATLDSQDKFISDGEFITSICVVNILVTLIGCGLWYKFWYQLNRLKIWNLRQGIDIAIGRDTSFLKIMKAVWRILRNLSNIDQNYIMTECGFEAFSYLYFLRRFLHLMAILTVSDFFFFIPYQIFYNDSFSLVSIESSSNYLFRTFYMLWVSVAVLYTLQQLKKYLRLVLKNRLLRGEKRLLNNIKTKTVLIHFAGEKRQINPMQMKTILIEKAKVEDNILACIELKDYSKKIQVQYEYQIYRIVKQIGIQNFSPIWRFFKEIKGNPEQYMNAKIQRAYQYNETNHLNSYLVAFQNMDTSFQLVNEFSSIKHISNQPEIPRSAVQDHFNPTTNLKMSVNWAQQACDIRWICIGSSDEIKYWKFVSMSILSGLLIAVGLLFIILSNSKNIIKLPAFILPAMLTIINAFLRWLISKSSEWQHQHFQYEWHKSQMKILLIFFMINTFGGSIVRDTLNLVDILKSGWGWLQLFKLIMKKPDGYFYYQLILNEISFTAFSVLFKIGDLFIQVFNSKITYMKNTLVRHKSKYGTNDPFRYGYYYSLNILIFAVIFMYSASCPLIHFFGLLYFYSMLYLYTYTLTVFHKYEQTSSNLRLLEQACFYIEIVMLILLTIIGVAMMFQQQYASVLIIYFWVIVIGLYLNSNKEPYFLKDYYTDQQFKTQQTASIIRQWRKQYMDSMEPIKVPY